MKRKSKMLESLVRVVFVTGLVGTGAISTDIVSAEEIFSDELGECSLIEDSSERLDCFDNFVGRHARAETVQPETAQATTSETQIQKAPDDLGAETLPLGARGDVEELVVRAVVTSCKKNSLGKYFFFFENGHVWKQTNDKRLRFTNCEFDVTITKDFFGYKMQRVGDTSQIRITRAK